MLLPSELIAFPVLTDPVHGTDRINRLRWMQPAAGAELKFFVFKMAPGHGAAPCSSISKTDVIADIRSG